jgi:hypothetical protein
MSNNNLCVATPDDSTGGTARIITMALAGRRAKNVLILLVLALWEVLQRNDLYLLGWSSIDMAVIDVFQYVNKDFIKWAQPSWRNNYSVRYEARHACMVY